MSINDDHLIELTNDELKLTRSALRFELVRLEGKRQTGRTVSAREAEIIGLLTKLPRAERKKRGKRVVKKAFEVAPITRLHTAKR